MDVNQTAGAVDRATDRPWRELPDIRLRGLTKRYGDFAAVDGVDLDVAQGEFFTLLGPSGSGKTTTLRLIAGFAHPRRGHGRAARRRRQRAAALRARRQHGLPGLRAVPAHDDRRERRVRAARSPRSPKAERRRRAAEALELVRLAGYEGRKPAQLSGGQRQRVALARAIVNRPKVLLLDEPLGALDLKLRQEMQVELKRIQGDVGITFVYVTHDQEEALTMSDRLAVFNEGRIEQVGAPAEVYEHPANAFVAGLRRRLERARARRASASRSARRRCGCRSGRRDGLHVEEGRVRDVAYAGMVTRYLVDLDAGGELQVVRQNLETSSAEALEQKGRRVRIGWREEHTFAIENKEEA